MVVVRPWQRTHFHTSYSVFMRSSGTTVSVGGGLQSRNCSRPCLTVALLVVYDNINDDDDDDDDDDRDDRDDHDDHDGAVVDTSDSCPMLCVLYIAVKRAKKKRSNLKICTP
jgi:hypothetical protein